MKLRWGSVSITGKFRENNEDAFVVHPEGRYFIVADGMGGQCAGEKASELAVELVPQRLENSVDFENADRPTVLKIIDDAVAFANSEIMALSQVDPSYHNMGTTIVFIVSVAGKFYIGGVGDSRAYLQRGQSFEQLTTDHSLTQALLDAGTINEDEAETHRYKNVLYRYLGTKDGGTGTDSREIVPQSGDRFVICSDGVTDGIKPKVMSDLLAGYDDPQVTADSIVRAAEDGGSKDNITCVIVHVL